MGVIYPQINKRQHYFVNICWRFKINLIYTFKDNSGSLSRQEFAYILKRLGEPLTDEEVDEILDHFDRDGSGEIDFDGNVTYTRVDWGAIGWLNSTLNI